MKFSNFIIVYLDKRAFSYLKNCQKILDVGCGTGQFIKNAPDKIIGLDSNQQTLKKCQNKGYKVKLGSATKLPFKTSSFNGLHCSHVIEHLQPKQVYRFLKEVARVLKPKGIFVLRSPLLWSGFYNNLTHLKPYPPKAITRYLVEHAPDTTFPEIKPKFTQIALHYRYNYRTLEKTGYTLVLKKIK